MRLQLREKLVKLLASEHFALEGGRATLVTMWHRLSMATVSIGIQSCELLQYSGNISFLQTFRQAVLYCRVSRSK